MQQDNIFKPHIFTAETFFLKNVPEFKTFCKAKVLTQRCKITSWAFRYCFGPTWPYSHPPNASNTTSTYIQGCNPTTSLLSKVTRINEYRSSLSRCYKQPEYTPHIYVYFVCRLAQRWICWMYSVRLEEGTWHEFGCDFKHNLDRLAP